MWAFISAPENVLFSVALAVILGIAFLACIFGGALACIRPDDETDAVPEDAFIGRSAKITLGTAEANSPAQAKLRDEYGQSHYIMVEPDIQGDVFETGRSVILVSRVGAVFKAITNDKTALFDS